jgi:hypothetical protein
MNRWMSVISKRKALVFLLLAWCGIAGADTIVVPNGYENREGGTATMPPFASSSENGRRYQQVYEAAWFTSLPAEGVLITEVRFRKDDEVSGCQRTVKRGQGGSKMVPFGQIKILHLKELIELGGTLIFGHTAQHYGKYT